MHYLWTIASCIGSLVRVGQLGGLLKQTTHLVGYCPLGRGKVNIPAILDIMAELDNDPKNPSPTAPVKIVKTSKLYMEALGIMFAA
jgi:hypothetical protein